MEKLKTNEISINKTDQLPLGQRLLQNGFKMVTIQEVKNMLGINKINNKLKNDCINELKKKYPKRKILAFPFFDRIDADCWWASDSQNYEQKELVIESINDYIKEKIPEHCLERINEAINIGLPLNKIYVGYIGKTKMKDPVIFGILYDIDFKKESIEDDNQVLYIKSWK